MGVRPGDEEEEGLLRLGLPLGILNQRFGDVAHDLLAILRCTAAPSIGFHGRLNSQLPGSIALIETSAGGPRVRNTLGT